MTFWEFEPVRLALRAGWVRPPAERPPRPPMGASIDTRTLEPGNLFFALRGSTTDGHDHLDAAARAGASLAVVERRDAPLDPRADMPVALVPSVPEALARLAGAWRAAAPSLKVVAVTGSNGKTTTVRLVHAIISATIRGSASQKSFNNHLGLPLTLLNARPGDQFVVCEIGTSSPGEIAQLARLARPDVAVVTSIGRAHLLELGSVEGVAREKSALLEHAAPGALGVIPDACEPLERALARFTPPRLVRVGPGDGADLRVSEVRTGVRATSFVLNGRERFSLPLLGAHNAHNAALAVAVARRFAIDDQTIRAALARVEPAAGRLARQRLGDADAWITLIDDCYNANPESMRAALGVLASARPGAAGRRVAVLGDMLELGTNAAPAHEEIGALVRSSRSIHAAVLVGPAMAAAARAFGPKATVFEELDADAVARLIRPADAVLVKGSRSVRLERVVHALRDRFAPRP